MMGAATNKPAIGLDAIELNPTFRQYTFHGIEAHVYRIDDDRHPYPWRFRIKIADGHYKHFAGTPNQCESRQSAMMRAKARCKWISEGTFDSKYR